MIIWNAWPICNKIRNEIQSTMYLQIHDVTGSPNREIFIVTDNCVRQKKPWFLMHCHSIYDDMYHSSGQLHQRFALRTLLVILGDQFTVSNMIDEKVTGMLLAAFMTWKSLLFWCSSSSLFQLYNCKFSVYRKKNLFGFWITARDSTLISSTWSLG